MASRKLQDDDPFPTISLCHSCCPRTVACIVRVDKRTTEPSGFPRREAERLSVVSSIGLSFVFGKHQCRAGMKGVCTSVMRLMCRAYSFRRCAAKHFPEADHILPDKGCYEGVVESVTQLTDSRRER